MESSSSRVKLLGGLFALLFAGSVGYLLFSGSAEEEADAKMKETLGKAAPGAQATAPKDERKRCPDCGKELPGTGECPYCLMKKTEKNGGKDQPPPVPRLGRYLAYTVIGMTVVLTAVHLGMFWWARRRFLAGDVEEQLKTKCPHCKRRVRFVARLANSYGACPTCKHRIQFKPMADVY